METEAQEAPFIQVVWQSGMKDGSHDTRPANCWGYSKLDSKVCEEPGAWEARPCRIRQQL